MDLEKISVKEWLNETPETKFSVSDGSIKFIHFFQMLCPGCIYFGIPQTMNVFQKFQSQHFKVYGIHSVFEHHNVMTDEALNVFMSEWKIPFPVGIDLPGEHWMPETMKNFSLQGTPSTLIFDSKGKLSLHHFGHFDEEKLHSFIEKLIN